MLNPKIYNICILTVTLFQCLHRDCAGGNIPLEPNIGEVICEVLAFSWERVPRDAKRWGKVLDGLEIIGIAWGVWRRPTY